LVVAKNTNVLRTSRVFPTAWCFDR